MNSSHPIATATLRWFTSSYSNGSGGECVECALTSEGMLVRDSTRRHGSALAVSGAAWRAFVGWAQGSQRSTAA